MHARRASAGLGFRSHRRRRPFQAGRLWFRARGQHTALPMQSIAPQNETCRYTGPETQHLPHECRYSPSWRRARFLRGLKTFRSSAQSPNECRSAARRAAARGGSRRRHGRFRRRPGCRDRRWRAGLGGSQAVEDPRPPDHPAPRRIARDRDCRRRLIATRPGTGARDPCRGRCPARRGTGHDRERTGHGCIARTCTSVRARRPLTRTLRVEVEQNHRDDLGRRIQVGPAGIEPTTSTV